MDNIKILLISNRHHCSQAVTGLLMLQQQGRCKLTFEDHRSDESFPRRDLSTIALECFGKRVLIDVEDGYFADSIMQKYLDWSDIYFKRSYSTEKNKSIPDAQKIHQYGFNYAVYYKGNPYNHLGKPVLKRIAQKLIGRANPAYFTPDRFECRGSALTEDATPRILFMARLWNPADCTSSVKRDERAYINDTRIQIIRELKKEYGPYFTGGIQPSDYIPPEVRDMVFSSNMTHRKQYLQTMHQHDICIGTMGLHESIGGKTAEYIAAGKAIVNERFHYEVPGSFEEGKNYLQFQSIDECMKAVERLVRDRAYLLHMQRSNVAYYERYLRPDALMENILKQVREM